MSEHDPVADLVAMLADLRVKGDLERLMGHFAEGATLRIVGFGTPAVGRNAIRTKLRKLIDAFEYVDVRSIRSVAQGDEVALRYELTVRHRPSGRMAELEVADFARMSDGKLMDYTQFVDTARVHALAAG